MCLEGVLMVMHDVWKRAGLLGLLVSALGAGHAAGPVVVTPGSIAGNAFVPGANTGTGAGSGSSAVEKLSTCTVTPASTTRTISLASRNWFGYNKPVTVYYKMVGGGSGAGHRPQLESAGGSTAILKNGTLVAAAPGMNAGGTRTPLGGSFTIGPNDSLQFILGGGGGGSAYGTYLYARQFCEWSDELGDTYCYNQWESYGTGVGGGGGAGYFGGGSGSYQADVLGGLPSTSRIAFGGTGTAGGAGYVAGALNVGGGGSGAAGGGNGGTPGTDVTWSYWTGWENAYYMAGGGGAQGRLGRPGASFSGSAPQCVTRAGAQVTPPVATTFDLSPNAGQPGSSVSVYEGTYGACSTPGGGYGEIVLQYQAVTCDLIPQYNQP